MPMRQFSKVNMEGMIERPESWNPYTKKSKPVVADNTLASLTVRVRIGPYSGIAFRVRAGSFQTFCCWYTGNIQKYSNLSAIEGYRCQFCSKLKKLSNTKTFSRWRMILQNVWFLHHRWRMGCRAWWHDVQLFCDYARIVCFLVSWDSWRAVPKFTIKHTQYSPK